MRLKKRSPLNRFRPRLEQLEDRWTPAVNISTANGTLSITGTPAGALLLRLTADDTYTVLEGLTIRGTLLPAPNGVNVQLSGAGGDVTLDTTGAFNITKNASFNIGSGGNTFTIDDTGGVVTIQGTLGVTGGAGDDSVALGLFGAGVTINGAVNISTAAGADFISIDGVTFGGNVTIAEGAGGVGDTLFYGFEIPNTLTGNLSVTGANDFEIRTGNSIGGNMSITTDADSASTVTIDTNSVIGSGPSNTHTITGSSTIDVVVVRGTVNGNLTATLGAGTNTFNASTDSSITGRFTYQGLANSDSVTLNGTIGSSASVNMGDAGATDQNTLTVDGTLLSSLQVNGGNGTDTVTVNTGSIIAGTLNVSLFNGSNTFTFAGTMAGGSAASPLQLIYKGGSGVDTVTYDVDALAAGAKLNVNLYDGDDVLNLNSDSFLSAFLDGGAGTGDVFANAVAPTNTTVMNFEA